MLFQGVNSTFIPTLILQVTFTQSGHMMVALLSQCFLLHHPQAMVIYICQHHLTITANFIFLWVLRILPPQPPIEVTDSTHSVVQTQPKWLLYLLELLLMVRLILLSLEMIYILLSMAIHLGHIVIT